MRENGNVDTNGNRPIVYSNTSKILNPTLRDETFREKNYYRIQPPFPICTLLQIVHSAHSFAE